MFFIVCGVVRALENPLPSGAVSHARVGIFFSRSFRSHERTKKRLGVLTVYTDKPGGNLVHKNKTLFFVASHTEWREPSDFSTGISGFSR